MPKKKVKAGSTVKHGSLMFKTFEPVGPFNLSRNKCRRSLAVVGEHIGKDLDVVGVLCSHVGPLTKDTFVLLKRPEVGALISIKAQCLVARQEEVMANLHKRFQPQL